MTLVKHAETLGYDSVWTAEAYGCDAVTMATWVAAHTSSIKVGTSIMQIPARSPAATAMTAIGLNALSGGRFLLGLGSSGPQVAEGWHSVAYDKPLTRSREYVEIIRRIMERKEPLRFQGYHYQLPMSGGKATGLGKPLKSVAHCNPDQAIYLASISPGGIRCAAEIGDGVLLSFLKPELAAEVSECHVREGLAKPGAHSSRDRFTVSTMVNVVITDEPAAVRAMMKTGTARSLGGMGAKSKNFYNEYAARMGYAEACERIQSLYLEGRKDEAAAAVPDAFLEETSLVGPRGAIRERLQAWRECERRGELDMMMVQTSQAEALSLLADELL
jgi:F420-dependent oxidoreductase-like protein